MTYHADASGAPPCCVVDVPAGLGRALPARRGLSAAARAITSEESNSPSRPPTARARPYSGREKVDTYIRLRLFAIDVGRGDTLRYAR